VNSFPANGAIDTGLFSEHTGANNVIELFFTNEYTVDRNNFEVSTFRWGLGNASLSDVQRIALHIAGNWYASAQAFSGTGIALGTQFGSGAAVAELDFNSASWLSVTFNPGVALSLGGVASLPAGNIDAFGILVDN